MHFSNSLNFTDIDFTKHNYSDGQLIWVRVPDWEMGVKILAFIPLIFLGFFGNSAIIVVVVQIRSMRTCTNLFITNMAVADLLTVLFSSWSYLIYDFYQNYILGRFCKVEGFIQVMCLLSSAFSLIVISCDRLLGIVFPFSRRLSKRQALIIIVCIWISAIACATPLAIWRSLSERQWADHLEIWCSENTNMDQLKYYWLIILTLLSYLPLTVMTVAYVVIICSLDRYEQQPFLRENPIKLKYRRRVIKMLFVYLLNCFWCWFTFQVVVLYRHFKPTSYELPNWYRRVFFVAHLFTYANGAINPIIYGACSENFRKGFRLIFSCFYQKNQVTPTLPDNKRHNNNKNQRYRHNQLTDPNEERQKQQIERKQRTNE
ncbi:substance-K receptor-like [Tachypleus tridentatus]|uniref:substance-K receptor-like n=1 Tax=Tachypleus tridentatus TaxID=6853 RepID=UPI003FD2B033